MELKEGYKQTEVGPIPEDWHCRNAGTIGRFRGGSGFPLRFQGLTEGDYPFFKVSDMNREGNDTFMLTANNYISEETRLKLGAVVFPPDSIVFAKVGAAVFLERKKIISVPSCLDNNMAAFVVNADLADFRFVHYWLLKFRLGSLVAATALPALSNGVLNEVPVPLPPTRAEQEAIANALSDADALIESFERLIAKKRQIKQGAMQELLTGKKRLPGFSAEWEESSFDEVLVRVNTRLFQLAKTNYQTSGRFPVVDQGQSKIIGFSDEESLCYRCPIGGVIVFGDHTCITKFIDFDFVVGADGTNILVGRDGQCTRFHAYQLEHKGITSTGYNRHFKFLREREFFKPKEDEQSAIATVLSDMDAEIDALETKLAKARQVNRGMMLALLTGNIRLVQPEKAHA